MSTVETAAQTARRLQAKGWSAGRILSALGQPGYGAAVAKDAVARILVGNVTPAMAVTNARAVK